jgi:hypothetical protein
MKVKNFDAECPICVNLRNDEDVICERDHIAAVLNPRVSAYPLRTALVPKRHPDKKGMQILTLNFDEEGERDYLKERMFGAIINAYRKLGSLDIREGQLYIGYMELPGMHPNGDIFPMPNGEIKIGKYLFPGYAEKVKLTENSFDVKEAKVIMASFPKSEGEKILLPEDLKRMSIEILKEGLNNPSPFSSFSV